MLLRQIFDRQRELMETYHDIEAENSNVFLYQSGETPVDINSQGGQARIKHLAWYVIEELAEALDAGPDKVHEEFSDAFHFFIELCIISGYEAKDFSVESDFQRIRVYSQMSQRLTDVSRPMTNFMYALGNAMNKLKNKPWKKSFTEVDKTSYGAWIALAMFHLIEVASSLGIENPAHLVELYMGKANINKQRQEGDY